MFSNAVKLFAIRGFDIKIDPSWLVIAALITWSLSQHYFPTAFPGETGGIYLVMAVAAMLFFFASLLLHELAHSVVARRFGVPIGGITLFLFGGVAELEGEPQSANVEFWIALAGPMMSFCLSLAFGFLSWITGIWNGLEIVTAVLSYLAIVNAVLAVFNLVPAFPLDGGRILRAYLWNRHGDLLRATETAAKSGVIFAYLLMGLGLLALFQGAVIAALWQIMIGGFVLVAARTSYQNQLTRAVFGTRTVGDLMRRDPVTVGPEVMLAEFVNSVMLRHGLSFIPVVENDILLGHIDHEMLSGIDREHWSNTRVGDVFAGLDEASSVSPDLPARDLMSRILETGRRKFLVVREHDLLGVISLSDLVRHLQLSDLALAN